VDPDLKGTEEWSFTATTHRKRRFPVDFPSGVDEEDDFERIPLF